MLQGALNEEGVVIIVFQQKEAKWFSVHTSRANQRRAANFLPKTVGGESRRFMALCRNEIARRLQIVRNAARVAFNQIVDKSPGAWLQSSQATRRHDSSCVAARPSVSSAALYGNDS